MRDSGNDLISQGIWDHMLHRGPLSLLLFFVVRVQYFVAKSDRFMMSFLVAFLTCGMVYAFEDLTLGKSKPILVVSGK